MKEGDLLLPLFNGRTPFYFLPLFFLPLYSRGRPRWGSEIIEEKFF